MIMQANQFWIRFNMFSSMMDNEEEGDEDFVKEAFLETNFYVLVLTFVVSIVHSIFEFLAFKNGKIVLQYGTPGVLKNG